MTHASTQQKSLPIASKHFRMPVAVHLVLQNNDEILLLLRQGTGFCDGHYSVVAGHLEGGESATQAMIREAEEEAGIFIESKDLTFSCVMHRFSPSRESIDIFYTCSTWKNEISNKEPHKCAELRFFSKDQLPSNMVGYVKDGILKSLANYPYNEYGWKETT